MTLEETIAQIYIGAFKELQKYIRQSSNPAKRNYWIAVARSMNKKIDKKVKELIETKFYPEYSKQMDEIEKMLTEGGISEGFGVTYYGAVEKVAENLTQNIDKLKVVIGRRTQDFWREAQLIEAGEKWATGASWKTMKVKLIQRIKNAGYLEFVDRTGRKWNLESYANMVARTVTRQASVAAIVDACGKHNHDLVRVSSHGTDCPICKPLEGQIFSLSGNDPIYPKWNYQIPAHPNCKHVIAPYVDLSEVKEKAKEAIAKFKPSEETPKPPAGILKKPSPGTPVRGHITWLSDDEAIELMKKDAQESGVKLASWEPREIYNAISDWSGKQYRQIRAYQEFGDVAFSFNKELLEKVRSESEYIEKYIQFSPKYKDEPIFRGVIFSKKDDPFKIFKVGDIIDQHGTSSWTSKKEIAEKFAGRGDVNGVVFVLKENQTGVSITHISRFGADEEEIIMSKDARYRVLNVTRNEKGFIEVLVEEVFGG